MKKLFESRAVVLECQAKQRLVEKEIELEHLRQKSKREWQGLTDVDVSKILDEQNGFYTFEKCFNFAKAIEAKLKERNT